jgi:hypothetical protein
MHVGNVALVAISFGGSAAPGGFTFVVADQASRPIFHCLQDMGELPGGGVTGRGSFHFGVALGAKGVFACVGDNWIVDWNLRFYRRHGF